MTVRRVIIWLCLAALVTTAHAQRYSFDSLGEAQGLANLNVNILLRDHIGFMWAGTENGLYRFEGGEFRRFGVRSGLGSEFILNLFVDGVGRLWVGADDGLYVSAGPLGWRPPHFIAIHGAGGHARIEPNSALADTVGGAVLAVQGGRLVEVNTSGAEAGWRSRDYLRQHAAYAGMDRRVIHSVMVARNGAIWLGCGGQLCQLSGGKVRVWGQQEGVPEGGWESLLEAPNGVIWARSAGDVIALAAGGAQFESRDAGLPAERANDAYYPFTLDPNGCVFTPLAQGVGRWRPGAGHGAGAWKLFGAAQGLPLFPATYVTYGGRSKVWLGIAGHGIARWLGYGDWQAWTTQNGLSNSLVWSVLQTAPNTVWVATEQAVDRINPQTGAIQVFGALGADGRQAVRFIEQTSDGRVWFVNRNGAVDIYNPVSGGLKRLKRFTGGRILGVLADHNEQLWLATTGGLYINAGRAGEGWQHVVAPVLGGGAFMSLAARAGGGMFAAGPDGLFELAKGSWRRVELPKNTDPRFLHMLEADGSLWVAKYAGGIERLWLAGAAVARSAMIGPPTLASTQIVFLKQAAKGWIWVGSDHGVDVFDGTQWRRATTADGLLWDDMDVNAFSGAADGSVWLGTSAGLSHDRRPQDLFGPIHLRAAVTRMSFGGSNLLNEAKGGAVTAKWKRAALTVQFTELGGSSYQNVRFRYRLKNLEDEWSTTSNEQVRYSALPSGSYQFQLQAVDEAQHVTSPTFELGLTVSPPWWRTVWFALLLLVIAGLLGWQGMRFRVRRMMEHQRALEALVQERTRELAEQNRELEAARAALHEEATRDGLTGLWNRTAIFERLGAELERCRREEGWVAVALLDLDFFKAVNDRWGHLRGDVVLREAARRFAAAARPYDYVGRYGGEEFLVVLPGLQPEAGNPRLEELRQAITQTPFVVDGTELRLTCSIGVAWVHGAASMDAVLDAADRALYNAKAQGRDRIEQAAQDSSAEG